MLEIDKLLAVRAIGLPPDLFIDVTRKVLAGWRARARWNPLPIYGRTRSHCG